MWNFRSPGVPFFYLVKDVFFCQKKEKTAYLGFQNFAQFCFFKKKTEKKFGSAGPWPLAVEVVDKQLKEIDGEGEDVNARDRALHREATVEYVG